MISVLSCGFTDRGSGRLLDRGAPALTVTAPCIWHGCGTHLSRRQPATSASAPSDHARVCLAAPPPASATLSACVVSQSKPRRPARHDGARALSLGSCGHLTPAWGLTWANGLGAAPLASTTFPAVPLCSPPYLVRLWCNGGVRGCPYAREALGRGCLGMEGARSRRLRRGPEPRRSESS